MMKDDDLEEFLLIEDLIFPEKESDDDDDNDNDDADEAEDNDDNDADDDDIENLAFVYSDGDRSSPTADPRPQSAPQVKGQNTLSPAATRFVAGLVTAGIAFFLVVLFILVCLLWK
jgi:hypothetical protein